MLAELPVQRHVEDKVGEQSQRVRRKRQQLRLSAERPEVWILSSYCPADAVQGPAEVERALAWSEVTIDNFRSNPLTR